MPQEPWKRAAQLKRAVPRESRQPLAELPAPRRSPGPVIVVTMLLLALVTVGLLYLWERSGSPTVFRGEQVTSEETTPGKSEATPSESRQPGISVEELDRGLGISLVIFGDYREILEQTRDKGVEWEFTASGDSIRMTSPGVTVYVTNGTVTAYTLDVLEVFAASQWRWWHRDLERAGISPETTYEQASGQSGAQPKYTLTSSRSQKLAEGWGSPAFELSFNTAGTLTYLRAGIEFGPSDLQQPPDVASSPPG